MFTRGRLVPRQPRAIKGTTRTELRGEAIVGVMLLIIKGRINWDISSCNLSCFTTCNDGNGVTKIRFNAVGVAFLIAQGCQAIAQATLG